MPGAGHPRVLWCSCSALLRRARGRAPKSLVVQLQRLATPCPGQGTQESCGAAAAPCYAVPGAGHPRVLWCSCSALLRRARGGAAKSLVVQLQRLATPCPGRGSQESCGAAAAPCYAVPGAGQPRVWWCSCSALLRRAPTQQLERARSPQIPLSMRDHPRTPAIAMAIMLLRR
ncbi:hypothetical protein MiSe_39080 [Microseira wollei NIES-4236]|uniref:Uncharacterized protein n=1 Tax=Microseira wollei NIES-4236 TaxID=2530354 RepID=A0AAV3WIC4_9CYAN|nr:hypothetical protein MiSe_39080 [Microseira wollei NIES-4236]